MTSSPLKRSKLGVTKFVGNLKAMVVHEWLFRTPECGVEEFPTEDLEFFGPDTLEEAEAKGFTACPHCLPYNQWGTEGGPETGASPQKLPKLGIAKFVGDRRWGVVHEWISKTSVCVVGEIPADSIVFFSPDTLEEAESKGFLPCPHCLIIKSERKE